MSSPEPVVTAAARAQAAQPSRDGDSAEESDPRGRGPPASLVFAATGAGPTRLLRRRQPRPAASRPGVHGLSLAQVRRSGMTASPSPRFAAKLESTPATGDALASRDERIDARVAIRARTPAAEAITLKAQVQCRRRLGQHITLCGSRARPSAPAGWAAPPRIGAGTGPGPRGSGPGPGLRRNRPPRRRPAVGVRNARDGRIGDDPTVLPCWDHAAHPRRRR